MANIIHIPGDYLTIQAGIDASNSGDTVLVDPATYYENLDFGQHDVVLASKFLTTGDQSFIFTTIIDGSQQGSTIEMADIQGSSLAIIGLTIQAGLRDTTGGSFGGGIRCENSNILIANNFIYGNICFVYGGGIYCYGSDVVIRNNLILQNVGRLVAGHGGGIACIESDAVIYNNTISLNSSDMGGGIYISGGNAEIANTIIYGNLAPFDSQISVAGGDPLFRYCDIEGGWSGEGIITDDPLFKSGDYHLMSSDCGDNTSSPCIDAGDPDIPDLILDCDWGLGTSRSDIGAFGGGDIATTGINDFEFNLPDRILLSYNYPNPFNASTTISYSLSRASDVSIEIYDLLGRRIETFEQGFQQPGQYSRLWDGGNVSSGIYYYNIVADFTSRAGKMTLLK
jgi:hypothetical protein